MHSEFREPVRTRSVRAKNTGYVAPGGYTKSETREEKRHRLLKLVHLLASESENNAVLLQDGVFGTAKELAGAFKHLGNAVVDNQDGTFTAFLQD